MSKFCDRMPPQPAAVASALFVKKVAALVLPRSIHSAQWTAAALMAAPLKVPAVPACT